MASANANNKDDNFLLNANTKIELKCLSYYKATKNESCINPNTYNGLIVPNDRSYDYIYEVDGVWLGLTFNKIYAVHILEPYKPQSGQNTKPATD